MKRTTLILAAVAAASISAPASALAGAGADLREAPVSAPAPAASMFEAKGADAYWTAERMLAAAPADVLDASPADTAGDAPVATGPAGGVDGAGAAPAVAGRDAKITSAINWPGSNLSAPGNTMGRVFFTKYSFGIPIGNYSCSAAVVNSPGLDTVLTAGHCVHGGPFFEWHRNWIFVPGYKNGVKPYGSWSANHFWSIKGWTQGGDHSYDVAFAILNPKSGQHVVSKFGGHGMKWNQPKLSAHYVYAFGYPAEAPFNGTTLKYCKGYMFAGFGDNELECNMTGGASGGPWLKNFDGTWGYANSNSSYKDGDEPGSIFGPYYGDAVKNLYNAAKND